jgi:hypothetical protein
MVVAPTPPALPRSCEAPQPTCIAQTIWFPQPYLHRPRSRYPSPHLYCPEAKVHPTCISQLVATLSPHLHHPHRRQSPPHLYRPQTMVPPPSYLYCPEATVTSHPTCIAQTLWFYLNHTCVAQKLCCPPSPTHPPVSPRSYGTVRDPGGLQRRGGRAAAQLSRLTEQR